jgi:bifunctional non-homologous end joining protein LigD
MLQRTLPAGFIAPCLPIKTTKLPSGGHWLHEIKHDGFRTLLAIERGKVTAFSRRGHEWSARYPRIIEAAAKLRCRSAIIDGEAIVQDENGVSRIEDLYDAIETQPHRLIFFAFDLLWQDGKDLRKLPVQERRSHLEELMGVASPYSALQFSEALAGDGAAVFARPTSLGWKVLSQSGLAHLIKSGRQTSWLKTKCMMEGEFVVLDAEYQPGEAAFALLAREIRQMRNVSNKGAGHAI